MKLAKKTAVTLAVGSVVIGAALVSTANANTFGFNELRSGYQVAADESGGSSTQAEAEAQGAPMPAPDANKGKEGKCGEGKCGDDKAKTKHSEGKCGEGKCGSDKAKSKSKEGSCGGDHKAGEGSCGGSM